MKLSILFLALFQSSSIYGQVLSQNAASDDGTEVELEVPQPQEAGQHILEAEDAPEASNLEWGPPLSAEDFELGKDSGRGSRQQTEMMRRGLTREKRLEGRSIQRDIKYRWPNAVVPYLIENSFDTAQRAVIASGIANVEDNTCITFRAATSSDEDWVEIFSTGVTGCFANARYLGPGHGKHEVGLEIGSPTTGTCVDKGVVVHELLHILGVAHEQQRPDRDTYVTMHWTNIQVDKAYNMWRDSWDTEDLASLTKCDDAGVVQATANFSKCVSGDTVTDYGVGYDFSSVMHYDLYSFAVDDSLPVMTPLNSSITSVGGNELSSMDITKLQRSYFCNADNSLGYCGGYHYSSSGGSINGNTVIGTNECESILSTDDGKGIMINITATFVGTCETDYLEIHAGKTKDAPLIGKYCLGSDPPASLAVRGSQVWMRWVRTTSTMSGTWSTFTVECNCDKVRMLDLPSAQSGSNGYYDKISTVQGGRPVYQMGNRYLFWSVSKSSWMVGQDINTNSYYVKNMASYVCPEDLTSGWIYFSGNEEGDKLSQDATMRCSDCSKFQYPEHDECRTCCNSIAVDGMTTNGKLNGVYEKTSQTMSAKPVYKTPYTSYYLFYSGTTRYIGADTNSYNAKNLGSVECPEDLTSGWETNTGINESAGTVRCSNCTLEPGNAECEECCSEFMLASSNSDVQTNLGVFIGNTFMKTQDVFNGIPVYQMSNDAQYCVWFNNNREMNVGYCSRLADPLKVNYGFMTAAAPYCFEDATGWSVWMNSQWSDDTTLMVQCQNELTTTSEVTHSSTDRSSMTTTSEMNMMNTTKSTTEMMMESTPEATSTVSSTENAMMTSTMPTMEPTLCPPCKTVVGGSLAGLYLLEASDEARCKDSCKYSKDGKMYCFQEGDDDVYLTCQY